MLVSSFIIFTLSYDSYTLQPTILRCRLLLNWWAASIHMRQWITIITITCARIRCLWVQLHDDNVVIQLFSWHTWSTSTPLCQHRSSGSTLFQTFHHRRPSFSGCRLTDLELTTRHRRFGINTAVVPAPIENFFFISTILYLLAL